MNAIEANEGKVLHAFIPNPVRETTAQRTFVVEFNDVRSVVVYSVDRDSLFCQLHKTANGCECTGFVRLCGVITHTQKRYLRFGGNS